jgi:hypothetical protein
VNDVCTAVFDVNVAVTVLAAFKVTIQDAVPVHAPDHPVNVDPVEATAESITAVPPVKTYEQTFPQLMPTGEEVTVPTPVPAAATERVYDPVGTTTAVDNVPTRYVPSIDIADAE